MLGTVFNFAQCFTLLLTPKLADRVGRKWVFNVSRIIECILYTVLMASDSYTVTLIVLAGLGLALPGLP